MAWEPVIKETHWFGSIEYDEGNDPNDNYGGLNLTLNFDGNNIKDIRGYANHHQGANAQPNPFGDRHFQTTFNCWQDDSQDNPKPRFRVNKTENWEVGRNNSNTYHGIGLKVKESVGSNNGTNFWIQNLDAGDKFIIEYYRVANPPRMPFLVSGSVKGRETSQNWSTASEIAGGPEYECPSGGEVCINIPGGTVIRGVTIIHSSNCYKKATTRIEQIHDEQNNIGYEMTLTGSGVLEDKRGAVPYITMRFGDMNDMTYVKYLGTFNGEKKYGASSIVDETDDLNPDRQNLQNVFKNHGEDWTKKKLIGKEWTVFTNNREILPLYGTYYYFFPEVDGKFNVKFYCEGDLEHLPLWYKFDANDGIVPFNDQLHLEMKRNGVTINSGDDDGKFFIGGNSLYDEPYYEYTVEFKKGGVYYLCSNPNNYDMERPVVRLMSYGFIPTFRVDPLYSVVENGSTKADNAATIKGVTIKEFTGINNGGVFNNEQKITINGDENAPMIKFLGNVTGATIKLKEVNGDIKLDFKDITYKSGNNINKGGAIVVNLDCPAGRATYVLTVAYNAADAKWGKVDGKDTRVAAEEGGVEVKKWDFFSKPLAVGTYGEDDGTRYTKDKNAWLAKSLLFREVHKADGLTADWVNTYVDVENSEEPIFKSVYDMEGDNADMLEETNGLIFLADANELGIYNENPESSTEFQDRYIGFIGGGEMWIPNLKAGDRIVLKMGRYGKDSQGADKAHLTITGAQDAVGKPITGDYVIGGSGVATGNDLNGGADITDPSQPWGEYHFISTGGHFKLKVTDATLLKLYSIVIYKHDDTILTENELLGDEEHLQILNTQDFTTAVDEVLLHVHYRGLNEDTNYAQKKALTGNLIDNDIARGSQTSDNSLWYTFSVNSTDDLPITPDKAKFGVFRARLGVQTIGNGDYVTDYADAMIPVGYRETKTYPYTWDFTDLKKYVTAGIDNYGTEKEVADVNADLRIWNNWNLRVAPEEWDGNIFASGGQLYGGKTMFDETRGIGITYDNNNNVTKMTGTSTDETGGLAVNDKGTYGFIVPQVDNGQAIYVRAAKVGSTQSANYTESKGYPTYTYEGQSSKAFPYSAEATDGTGDWVFALVMQNKNDVRLNFQGYEVKKIAVSTDSKAVNSKGWTSESRDHAIDASLLPYFTGKKMKTYVVSDPNYTDRTLKLTDVGAKTVGEENKCVIPASTGCLIYNPDNGAFNPFGTDNKGFHLFVPDMHDGEKAFSGDNNLLVANVADEDKKLEMFDGDKTNYALTYRYQMLKEDGTPYGDVIEGDEMFYRVSNKGIKLHKNSAYLQLPTSEVKPSPSRPAGCPMFSFIFTELDEGETVITGIEEAGVLIEDEEANAVWYNLNGQKLNGKPSARGIYIRNGKKVFVK